MSFHKIGDRLINHTFTIKIGRNIGFTIELPNLRNHALSKGFALLPIGKKVFG